MIALCLVLIAFPAVAQINYSDFSSVAGLNLVGDAAQSGTALRLTPNQTFKYGGAWYANKQYLQHGFQTRFQFQISNISSGNEGGRGFTFTLQNDNAAQSVGANSVPEEIGDGQIKVGLAVEFQMGVVLGNLGEKDNQVSIHTNGPNTANNNIAYSTYAIGSATPSVWMKDSNVHTVKLHYVPGTLSVFLDDTLNALLTVSVDLTNVAGGSILDNNGNAWTGFTAGTNNFYEDQDILNWTLIPDLFVQLANDTICGNAKTKLPSIVTGGIAPVSLQWSPATGLDSPNVATPSITLQSSATYTLTATDARGVLTSSSMNITVLPHPTVDAGIGCTLCRGSSGILNGVPATGGVPPYSYSWKPIAGVVSPNELVTNILINSTTTYYLTVTDANGCTGVDSCVAVVNDQPVISPADFTTLSLCTGDSVRIGGPATGEGPFTYEWSPSIGLSATDVASPIAFPSANTTYQIVITDRLGCQNKGRVIIELVSFPQPHIIAHDTVICAGDTTTLTSTDSNYTSFRWSTGDTTRSIHVSQSGSYTVTATSNGGCAGTSPPVAITVLPAPATPVISVSGSVSLCEGNVDTLSAQDGYSSYRWSTGATTKFIITPTSGIFTVTVTGANGCKSTSLPVTITLSPNPKPEIFGPSSTCVQSTETYSVNDNSTGNTFAWSVSAGGIIQSGNGSSTITVRWSGAGTEQLFVTETHIASGCSKSTSMTITIGTSLKPKISVGGDTVLCGGDSVVLDAGAGFAQYDWSNGATTQTITVINSGSYAVHVADAGGCAGTSDTLHVAVVQNFSPSITGTDTVCANSTASYFVPNDHHFVFDWNVNGGTIFSGANADTVSVRWGSAGNGTVNVTVHRGSCTSTTSMTVIVGNTIAPEVTADGPSVFCIDDSVTLSAPSGFATYLWSNGVTTQTLTVHTSGTYFVTVMDSTGCSGVSAPIAMVASTTLQPVITGANAFCPGDSATLDAGIGYDSYLWSTGATTRTITTKTPGTFHVAVTMSTCSGTSTNIGVIEYASPVVTIAARGDTLETIAAQTYQWLIGGTEIPGATSQSYVTSQQGMYSVRITDLNGCTTTSAPFAHGTPPVTATVAIGTIPQVNPGITVEVPIELVSSQNLITANANHYIGVVRYNGTMLIPKGSRGGLLGTSGSVAGSNDRTTTFEGSSSPLTSGTLQWLQFDALFGTDSCSTIKIDTFYWEEVHATVTRQSGEFCESGICVSGGGARLLNATGLFALQPVRPNPATDHITFEYDLTETGRTQIVLRDMMGRAVNQITDEAKVPGHYTADVPLHGLMSGCYVCVLQTPSQQLRQLFLVRK